MFHKELDDSIHTSSAGHCVVSPPSTMDSLAWCVGHQSTNVVLNEKHHRYDDH
jgi:hypothetical protein